MKLQFAVVTSDGREMRRYDVEKDSVTVGRAENSDIVLAADIVSGAHAVLREQGGAISLVDLNSTNGTFLNGSRVSSPEVVKSGDHLTFGVNGPTIKVCSISASDSVADRQSAASSDTRALLAEMQRSQMRTLTAIGGGVTAVALVVIAVVVYRHFLYGGIRDPLAADLPPPVSSVSSAWMPAAPVKDPPTAAAPTTDAHPATAATASSMTTPPPKPDPPKPEPPLPSAPVALSHGGAYWLGLETNKVLLPMGACWAANRNCVLLSGPVYDVLRNISPDEKVYVCGGDNNSTRLRVSALRPHPKATTLKETGEYAVALALLDQPLSASYTAADVMTIDQARAGDNLRTLFYEFVNSGNSPFDAANPPRLQERGLVIVTTESSTDIQNARPVYRVRGSLPEAADGAAIFDRSGRVFGTLVRSASGDEHRVIPIDRLSGFVP